MRFACIAVLFLLACSARPELMLGSECELSTQCASPLVCRLGHCRDECRFNRDCRAGLVCLLDENRLGACELPTEDHCALSSECTSPLVCLMGRCSDACMTSRDCPAGSVCLFDDMNRPIGCHDMSTTECTLNSDCPAPLVCTPDRHCNEQCHTSRDCRDGYVCDTMMSPNVCVPPSDDAGPPDDTGIDGGNDAGTDTGIDAAVIIDVGTDMGLDAAMAMTGPPPIPLLVGGSDHFCATRASDGQLRCWGNDAYGEVGDGMVATSRPVATLLNPVVSNVTMLAAGALHSCAYSTSMGLRCWGDGRAGQIGDNMIVSHATATAVSGAIVPTWIAAGNSHTCAVVAGAVQCWGDNSSGQLGDGTTSPHRTPTATLPLAASAVQIEARSNWTCARLVDGRVQCWGDGHALQLGVDISPAVYSGTPHLIGGVTGAVDIAMGASHGCARAVNGVVSCWGSNSQGQLGDGTVPGTMRAAPAPTATMPPAVEIAASGDHTCARTIDGDVYCWGDNFDDSCGQDGFAMARLRSPTRVTGIANATELTMADGATCVRTASGVSCWGTDDIGQLGDNSTVTRFTSAAVMWL